MYRTNEMKSHSVHSMMQQALSKVEFSTIQCFVEEMAEIGVQNVRLDIFEDVRQSELSFVYYVTLMLYLTAQDPTGCMVYEYREAIGTTASPDRKFHDDVFLHRAQNHIQEVEHLLIDEGLCVRRGRYLMTEGHLM